MNEKAEWVKSKLEDVIQTLIDYRGKTPNKTSFGVPLITAKVVKGGFIQEPNEFIAENDYESWMTRGFPKIGDVVLTVEAPLGEVAQIKMTKIALAQRIITLRGKESILDNSYLKYFFQSDIGQRRLKARETGTTVTGIKQSELKLVEIDMPDFKTQKRIASILSSLDDKIELNRQTNKTLEAIAQTLFKEMCLPKGEELPEGWNISKLGDIIESKGGTTPSTKNDEFWNGEYHWATPKDLANLTVPVLLSTERLISAKGLKQISSGLLPKGTLLMSSRAPIGYFAISQIPVAINQGFIAMNGIAVSNLFLLNWLKTNLEKIKSMGNGSTFLEISKTVFRSIEIIVPNNTILNKFEEIVSPIFQKIVTNEQETQTLTTLRDSLLPKLMKGEIAV